MNHLSLFGENLKKERLKANMTQEETAHLAGFHRTYIGLLESGKRNPSLETILKIAETLKCDPRNFLKGMNKYDS